MKYSAHDLNEHPEFFNVEYRFPDEEFVRILFGKSEAIVSSYGRVISVDWRGIVAVAPWGTSGNYYTFGTCASGTKLLHRIVAEAFLPNPLNKPVVNHIDGNKRNPHLSNLEWSTHSENSKHAHATGLFKKNKIREENETQ